MPKQQRITFDPRNKVDVRDVFRLLCDDRHLDIHLMYTKTKVKNNTPSVKCLLQLCDMENVKFSSDFIGGQSEEKSKAYIVYFPKVGGVKTKLSEADEKVKDFKDAKAKAKVKPTKEEVSTKTPPKVEDEDPDPF